MEKSKQKYSTESGVEEIQGQRGNKLQAKYSTCESVEGKQTPGTECKKRGIHGENSIHTTGPQTEQSEMNSLQEQGIYLWAILT